MRFPTRLLEIIIFTAILMLVLFNAYCYGYQASELDNVIEPVSSYFWIDNDRFIKDSQVNPTPLYNESGDIIGSNVRIESDTTVIYKEFLDSEDMTWKEDLDSWIMAWKEEDMKNERMD